MAELIERQAAIDAVMAVYASTVGYKTRERVWETREAIQKLPAAEELMNWISVEDKLPANETEVLAVVHGRWKLLRKGDWTSVFVCSVCGRRETIAESESYNSQLKMPREYPYCHCGAMMDGGNENDR